MDDVLFNNTNSKELVGKTCLVKESIRGGYSNHLTRVRAKPELCVPNFLALLLHNAWRKGEFLKLANKWIGQAGVNAKSLSEFQIPLPPLEVQKEIVAELEGYQKVIDGARAVVDNYRPHIPIHPDWPVVELGDIVVFTSGGTPSKANDAYWTGEIPWVSAKDLKVDRIYDAALHISEVAITESATQLAPVGSLLVLVRGMGLANGVPICEVMRPCAFNQDLKALIPDSARVLSPFLAVALRQQTSQFKRILETAAHGTLKINSEDLRQIKIPLPKLETQQKIVTDVESEQSLVAASRELVGLFEKKITASLSRVWGEEEQS